MAIEKHDLGRAIMSHVKFFPHDVESGEANKVGDKFVAFFLTGYHSFEVTEHHGGFFFAKLADE